MLMFLRRHIGIISVAFCTALLTIASNGLSSVIHYTSDYRFYQEFAEQLAHGNLDLSIPGFHGADFLSAIIYLVSGSPMSHIVLQLLCGLLIPFVAYGVGYNLYQSKAHGILLACILTLMPYSVFSFMTGYTQTSNIFLFLLAIYGSTKNTWWTGVVWALAVLTKPFAIIALPLLLIGRPATGTCIKRNLQILIGIALAATYVIVQYLQIGTVLVGVHGGTESLVIWDGIRKVIGNIAWGIQALFSIHNYYYANPAITGDWNLLHTSPLLIMLGLFGLFAPKTFFTNTKLHCALAMGAALGFTLNAVVSMDNYYMQFLNLMFILAALPVLLQHTVWIPVVVLTFQYQWFYFYREFHERAPMEWYAFAPIIVADIVVALWILKTLPVIGKRIRSGIRCII